MNGKGEQDIPPDDRLWVETPGGGGYGLAEQRSEKAITDDLRSGLVSKDAATRDYGFTEKR